MNTLIFKDGKKAKCLSVIGALKFVKGAERDCLTFNFDAENITPNELMSLFSDKNETSEIRVCIGEIKDNKSADGEDAAENIGFIYSDYTLFIGLEIKEEITQKENNTSPENTMSIIAVTMGQMNYSEKLIQEQKEQLDNLSEVFADILGGALQ